MKPQTSPMKFAIRTFITTLAAVVVVLQAQSQTVTPGVTNIWRLAAGVEPDFAAAADNLVRGVAINPVNGNVVYASRTGGSNHIAVVNAVTGFVSNRLSGVGIAGGTLVLDYVKVADDGVIYAFNLAAATSTLKIYRWDSDSTTSDPTNIFTLAGVTTRYGDTLDLRGFSTNAEIVISGTSGTKICPVINDKRL